ncbi:MAG TPA: hypothetical protein DIT63_01255 [Gammaproteobacteria bacterium]|nr:hypothetical protein [Gammaproteobacteria bacterium]
MSNTTPQITRTSYGELSAAWVRIDYQHGRDQAAQALIDAALQLAAAAAARGKLPAPYDDMEWGRSGRERGKRIGSARHHEVYDVTPTGHRALICVREVEGSRYGVRTTSKTYYVVARHGAGVRVLPANKAVAAKAAKAAGDTLGAAIAVCLGKAPLRVAASAVRTGYKLLVRTEAAGVYASAWDGSTWELGKARVEAASDDHTGGYYYYASLDECLAAAAAGEVFAQHRAHDRLAVVEVEASGRHYEHSGQHGTKLCASRVRPVREIASTVAAA